LSEVLTITQNMSMLSPYATRRKENILRGVTTRTGRWECHCQCDGERLIAPQLDDLSVMGHRHLTRDGSKLPRELGRCFVPMLHGEGPLRPRLPVLRLFLDVAPEALIPYLADVDLCAAERLAPCGPPLGAVPSSSRGSLLCDACKPGPHRLKAGEDQTGAQAFI